MSKKCIICGDEDASFEIKGTGDSYCEACAIENFGDVSYLEKIEEKALKIQRYINEKTQLKEDKEENPSEEGGQEETC